MKNTRLLTLIVLTALATACSDPSGLHRQEAGRVSLTLMLRDPSVSRTVTADITAAVVSWRIILTSRDGYPGHTADTAETTYTFEDVETGTWDIAVEGRNRAGQVIAAGVLSEQVLLFGPPVARTVAVGFLTSAEGTGSYSLTAAFSPDLGIDSVTALFDNTEFPVVLNTTDPALTRVVFSGENITSGPHALTFTFYRGTDSAGTFREAVNVWDNTLSNRWIGSGGTLLPERLFTRDDLFEANALLENLTLNTETFAFSSGTDSYEPGLVNLPALRFTATQSLPGQVIRYTWNGGTEQAIVSGQLSPALPLTNSGLNTLTLTVTAPDGVHTRTVTVTLTRGFAVTFDGNGAVTGSVPVDAALYPLGGTVTLPGNTGGLAWPGYYFDGWSPVPAGPAVPLYVADAEVSMPAGGLALFARWQPVAEVAVIIQFSLLGAAPVFNPDTVTAVVGVPVTIAPTDPPSGGTWQWYVDGINQNVSTNSFTFTGTNVGIVTVSFVVTAPGRAWSGDLLVSVVAAPATGWVWYDPNGGTGGATADTFAPGANVTVGGAPTHPLGYDFAGWQTSDLDPAPQTFQADDSFTMPENSVRLTAQWTENNTLTALPAREDFGSVLLSWTETGRKPDTVTIGWLESGTPVSATIPGGIGAYRAGGLTNGTDYTFTVTPVYNTVIGTSVSVTATPDDPARYAGLVNVPYRGGFVQGDQFTHILDPFAIGRYEVTYRQWYGVRVWALSHGYSFANFGREGSGGTDGAAPLTLRQPVTFISKHDMMVWCNALSEKEGLRPVYYTEAGCAAVFRDARNEPDVFIDFGADGYRLPTEGEWEYAARYISGTAWLPINYASGASGTSEGQVSAVAVCNDTATAPVGTKNPNALGLYDMSGNVAEVVQDSKESYPTSTVKNRLGRTGDYLQIIGGWFENSPVSDPLKTGFRTHSSGLWSYSSGILGFRLARSGRVDASDLGGKVYVYAAVGTPTENDWTIEHFSLNSMTGALAQVTSTSLSGRGDARIAIHPRGSHLFALGSNISQYQYDRWEIDSINGSLVEASLASHAEAETNATLADLSFSPGGDFLAFWTGATVHVLNTVDRYSASLPTLNSFAITGLESDANRSLAWFKECLILLYELGGYRGQFCLINPSGTLSGGGEGGQLPFPSGAPQLRVGGHLYSLSIDQASTRIDRRIAESGSSLYDAGFRLDAPDYNLLTSSPDGRYLFIASTAHANGGRIYTIARNPVSGDLNQLFALDFDATTIPLSDFYFSTLTVDPSGRFLLVSGTNGTTASILVFRINPNGSLVLLSYSNISKQTNNLTVPSLQAVRFPDTP
jgi:uncharacterized repeat protein (TIGR02543 family)